MSRPQQRAKRNAKPAAAVVRTRLRAGIVDGEHEYVGRPGLNPALAALVAADVLRPEQRILDVGCGRGGDLIALAKLGFGRLTGIDHNRRSIASAKRRKGARGIDWRLAPLTALLDEPEASYDVVLSSFLVNNLPDDEVDEHLAWLARLLPQGGVLVVQSKASASAPEGRGRGGVRSPCFAWGKPALTWFPEYRDERRGDRWVWTKGAVPGFVQVGRRNGRAAPTIRASEAGAASAAPAKRARNGRGGAA